MFLRNLVHGAPITTPKIAHRLKAIDRKLNATTMPDRQIHKSDEYYTRIATDIARARA